MLPDPRRPPVAQAGTEELDRTPSPGNPREGILAGRAADRAVYLVNTSAFVWQGEITAGFEAFQPHF
jgi:hypothetical protein